jgi:hypothetical protein
VMVATLPLAILTDLPPLIDMCGTCHRVEPLTAFSLLQC